MVDNVSDLKTLSNVHLQFSYYCSAQPDGETDHLIKKAESENISKTEAIELLNLLLKEQKHKTFKPYFVKDNVYLNNLFLDKKTSVLPEMVGLNLFSNLLYSLNKSFMPSFNGEQYGNNAASLAFHNICIKTLESK